MRAEVIELVEDSLPLVRLRQVQQAVMDAHGLEDWKPVSSVTRWLVSQGYLAQIRKGSTHWLAPGPRFGDRGELIGEDRDRDRAEAFRILDEKGGARVEARNPMTPAMREYFMEKYHRGELDLCFVPARARVVAYQVEKGTTLKVDYWDGLKYEQGRGHGEDVV